MTQYHFDPAGYDKMIRAELPWYDELQLRVAQAAAGGVVERILELGAGTGVTTEALLRVHPGACVVAVDMSASMLERIALPQVETHVARLEEPLPDGPFDLVVSALAVHHLDAAGKRDLFARVHRALRPDGRFVLGDVVVADVAVAPISDGYDMPDPTSDQVEWLTEAGFDAHVLWEHEDAAVIAATKC